MFTRFVFSFIILLASLCAAPRASAQDLSEPAAAGSEAPQLLRSGTQLRRYGVPLTIAGAIAVPVGIALLVGGTYACVSSLDYYNLYYGRCAASQALYAFGAILEITGWPALGGGIALWVIGNQRIEKAKGMGARSVSLLPAVRLLPQGGAAAALTLRVGF